MKRVKTNPATFDIVELINDAVLGIMTAIVWGLIKHKEGGIISPWEAAEIARNLRNAVAKEKVLGLLPTKGKKG